MTGLVSLSNAYTDMQMKVGLLHSALYDAMSRARRAEAELDELRELLRKAIMLRDRGAAEWLATLAEVIQEGNVRRTT